MPGDEFDDMAKELQGSPTDKMVGDLMASLTVSKIASGILFGVIGLWMFKRGKSNSDLRIIAIGIALMFYPYLTNGPVLDWGVGIALCGLAYYLWNR
jgi:hypothetical protein